MASSISTSDSPTPRRLRLKPVVLTVALLAGAGYGANWGWHWWNDGRFQETTDDAFLQSDKVVVAPKVGGFVAELAVGDNQPVRAGEVLARIDDKDYQVVLAQDEADLEKSKASLEGVGSALIQQQARIIEARADVANTSAALAFARQEDSRYAELFAKGAGTSQRTQQAASDLRMKTAALDKANAGYEAAQKQIDGLRSLEAAARATLRRSEINLQQARLNIGYTTVVAPIDGVVGDRSVRRGQLVQPGTNLLTVVPMGEAIFLVANFKETQVGAMKGGQAASFTLDAFRRPRLPRAHRELRARHRVAVRAAAAGKRHGQLHQGGAARAGAHRARPRRPDDRAAAAGPVRPGDGRRAWRGRADAAASPGGRAAGQPAVILLCEAGERDHLKHGGGGRRLDLAEFPPFSSPASPKRGCPHYRLRRASQGRMCAA